MSTAKKLSEILSQIASCLLSQDHNSQQFNEFFDLNEKLGYLLVKRPPSGIRILPTDLELVNNIYINILSYISTNQVGYLVSAINQLNTFLKAKISDFEHPS